MINERIVQNNQSMSNQQISMDKKYKTRSGSDVRILCTDGPGRFPVIGLLDQQVLTWQSNGEFMSQTNSFDLIEQKPYSAFKVDDPVMVRNSDNEEWQSRYFSHVDGNGHPNVWVEGRTSFTSPSKCETYPWNQCRKPTEEELKGCKR